MVNRLDAADLAALSFIKGMDGLSPLAWLQLQGLIAGRSPEDKLNHAELSKLVKNILDASTGNLEKGRPALSHFTTLLPSFNKLTPETVKIVELSKGDLLPASPKTDKIDPKAPNQVETSVTKEKKTEQSIAQKPIGTHQHTRSEEHSLKSQHVPLSQPLQQAVKEVVKALHFLGPQIDTKEVVKAEISSSPKSTITPTDYLTKPELQTKPKPNLEDPFVKTESPTKSPKEQQAAKPRETIKLNQEPVNKAESKDTTRPLEQKKEATVIGNFQQIPPQKKEAELSSFQGFRGAAQEQAATQQPRSADRTIIPGAPFQAPLGTSESRRKEKRKYPNYHSDQEEGEDAEQNNDPNHKRR